ncbi:hypothetical protein U1Q18_007380, partial [Sarracenia purpurea var. burkii]
MNIETSAYHVEIGDGNISGRTENVEAEFDPLKTDPGSLMEKDDEFVVVKETTEEENRSGEDDVEDSGEEQGNPEKVSSTNLGCFLSE